MIRLAAALTCAQLIRDAQGLAIFTVFRTGLGFSAASGSGVVIARDAEGSKSTHLTRCPLISHVLIRALQLPYRSIHLHQRGARHQVSSFTQSDSAS